MKRNVVLFALMVVVVAGLLVLGQVPGQGFAGSAVPAPQPWPPRATTRRTSSSPILQGHTLKLSDLRGKAVVLNFWATWCPPCKEEIPWFVELQKRYGAAGIADCRRQHG